MVFVTGGYRAGKRAFVAETFGYTPSEFSDSIACDSPIVYDLQDVEITSIEEVLLNLSSKQVVICNELGCGVVPIDKSLREKRELVGKLCIEIAKKADEVYRVYAGIGVRIK